MSKKYKLVLFLFVFDSLHGFGWHPINLTKFQEVVNKFLDKELVSTGISSRMTCGRALAAAKTARLDVYDHVNLTNFASPDYMLCPIAKWTRVFCLVPVSELQDGWSACLTDECGKDVFYCADNNGCISIKQVRMFYLF